VGLFRGYLHWTESCDRENFSFHKVAVRRSAATREKHEVFFSQASGEGEADIQPPEPRVSKAFLF